MRSNDLEANEPKRIRTSQSKKKVSNSKKSRNYTEDVVEEVTTEQQQELMRILSCQYHKNQRKTILENSSLRRRMRDFQFAQQKRTEKYGTSKPWGILGLYEHLSSIRADLEWAEDAAWRRQEGEPYLSWNDYDLHRDDGFNKPFFTYFLLFICTCTLVASIGLNGWKVEPMSVNPMIGPSAETLILMGAKDTPLIVIDGEWYRLFTPMFLHAGVIHYVLNMLALWFIGKAVEMCHGFIAAFLLFVIPAIGGTILSAIFLPGYISVGASGGIFGLIGACLADIVMNWSLIFSKEVNSDIRINVRILCWLIVDIVINCMVGLTPFVDNFTHLGGFCYGFLCGLSSLESLSKEFFGLYSWSNRLRQCLLRFFGLIISVSAICISLAVLFTLDGTSNPCPSCRYVSCIPFPFWKEEKWWYCDDCAVVSADVRKKDSQFFDELSLTCPDGTIEDIDISYLQIVDSSSIAADLPIYCRNHCENTFS